MSGTVVGPGAPPVGASAHHVVVGARNQVVSAEVRSMVSEVDGFVIDDVADSSDRLEDAVVRRDPDIVLVHADIGPTPVLQVVRDLALRRPGTAILVLVAEVTPTALTEAVDAGARGVLAHPPSLEELQARLSAAGQWSAQMRRHLHAPDLDQSGSGRGRVFAVAGSKGGVGASTLAVHLATDFVRAVPGKSVCLVDLDVEKGDLANLLGVDHRLDVSDLAKVADDLAPATVSSAVHRDPSGMAVVTAPRRIEDVGAVGDREARLIVGAVRRQFDVVVLDVGSHVTPVSAAVVEIADEVVLVTNPDVLALRGVHRTLEAWSRVGVRKAESTRLVLNRCGRGTDLQPEAVGRLVPTPPCRTHLPAVYKRLEPGLNYRDPAEVKDRAWWTKVGELSRELGLVGPELDVPNSRQRGQRHDRRGRRGRGGAEHGEGAPGRAAGNEAGHASLEFVGVLPVLLLLVVLAWQVGLSLVSVALTGHVADEAARQAAIGQPVEESLGAVPRWFGDAMTVTSSASGDSVTVRTDLPILAPGVYADGWDFTTEVGVVVEPS